MLDDNIVNAPNKYRETEGTNRDKAKGIVAKPMPRYWHDRHSVNQIEDPEEKRFQLSIVADKKPYFMRVIYPALSKQYNTYIKTTNKNARREFGMSIEELEAIPEENRTERQNDFIRYYYSRIPVGIGDCVMNKICRRFEKEFDGYLKRRSELTQFDYSIIKSNAEYTKSEFKYIGKLYDSYRKRLQQFVMFTSYERVNEYEAAAHLDELKNEFVQGCDTVCPNHESQCNAILDLCYTKAYTKKFAWEICGDQMILNLLERNKFSMIFPTADESGEIEFKGMRFREEVMEVGHGDCTE